MKTSKEALKDYLDEQPHYMIHLGTGWHSWPFENKARAQAWLDGYGVTQTYKDHNYRIVSVAEYWKKRAFST